MLRLIAVLCLGAVKVHICMAVLDSSQCGDHGEPSGWTTTCSGVIRDVLTVSKVGRRIEVELKLNRKMRIDPKVKMGCWGSVSDVEKYDS